MMTPPLQGHTVLVTGAACRLGAALARALAGAGADLVLHHHRSDPSALVAELAALPRRVSTVCGPLDGAADAANVFEAAQRAAGAVTLLVNNAARYSGQKLGDDGGDGLWQANTLAPLALMRAFANALGGRPGTLATTPCIVNLLDARIAHPAATQTPLYTATKSALATLTLAAAAEFAPHVRVNAIAPGPVLPSPDVRESAGSLPLGHRPTPEDVCAAALYLLSARSVTGQILYVDSGQHLVK